MKEMPGSTTLWLLLVSILSTWKSPVTGYNSVYFCTQMASVNSSNALISTPGYPAFAESKNCSCTITALKTIVLELQLKFQADEKMLKADTCGPILHVQKSQSLPYYVCHHSDPFTDTLQERSSYSINVFTPDGLRSMAQISLRVKGSAVSSGFTVSCGPVLPPVARPALEKCACRDTRISGGRTGVPLAIYQQNIGKQFMVGCLAALCFLICFAVLWVVCKYYNKQFSKKASAEPVSAAVPYSTPLSGQAARGKTPNSDPELNLNVRTLPSGDSPQGRPFSAHRNPAFKGSTDSGLSGSGLSGSGVDLDAPGYSNLNQERHPRFAEFASPEDIQPQVRQTQPHDVQAGYQTPHRPPSSGDPTARPRMAPLASPEQSHTYTNQAYLPGSRDRLDDFYPGNTEDDTMYIPMHTPGSSPHNSQNIHDLQHTDV